MPTVPENPTGALRSAADAGRLAGHAARIALLEQMLLIRAYDHRLAGLVASGTPGTCLTTGQEAGAVGVVRALDADDLILTNHRSAGHLIARGADPGRMMAEVMGRAAGYCRGRSGTLHISAASLGVVLTSTIVGGELSLAPGVALAQQMGVAPRAAHPPADGHRVQQPMTAVFFGDGAACQGIFHESVNLAVMWQLPLLYVCENNQWQAFVPRRRTMPNEQVSDWMRGHGIAIDVVDGNDVEAVLAAARRAVDSIRETGRPRLLELVTYRMRGHFEPDPQSYVDPAELARWRERDPIELLASRLLADAVLAPAELDSLRRRVDAATDAALEFALASPPADAREVDLDVYA